MFQLAFIDRSSKRRFLYETVYELKLIHINANSNRNIVDVICTVSAFFSLFISLSLLRSSLHKKMLKLCLLTRKQKLISVCTRIFNLLVHFTMRLNFWQYLFSTIPEFQI